MKCWPSFVIAVALSSVACGSSSSSTGGGDGGGGDLTPVNPVVTPSVSHVQAAPASAISVAIGATQTFTVTPDAGYAIDTTVGGTCPAGTWSDANTYVTGAITADCSISFSGAVLHYAVTAIGQNVTPSPTGIVTVDGNATKAFTVTANDGFLLTGDIGGTCPAGSWTSNTYTTGAINANCTVTFNGIVPLFTVTASGGNLLINPSTPQNVVGGRATQFEVTGAPGYAASPNVAGDCPIGNWNATTYATGVLTTDCNVIFTALPFPQITNPAIYTTGVHSVSNTTTVSLSWTAPVDGGTAPSDQNYTVCVSAPNPLAGTFSSVSAVLGGTCTQQTGTTTANVAVASGHSYFFNVVVQDMNGSRNVYRAKGELADGSLVTYIPFDGGVTDVAGPQTLVAASYQGSSGAPGAQGVDRFGDPNNAYVLDSNNNECLMTPANLDSSVTGTNSRTVTFWAKAGHNTGAISPLSFSGSGANLATGDHFGLITDANLQYWYTWLFGEDQQTPAFYDNSWHFWAIIYNGAAQSIAVVQDGSFKYGNTITLNTPAERMFVGCGSDGSAGVRGVLEHFFSGEIDDVRVFNRVVCPGASLAGCDGNASNELSYFYRVTAP